MCNKQTLWTISCIVFFIITLLFNYLSTSGVFNNTDQKELSDKYGLPITPPGWVFSVWGLIYIWQAVWQLYLLYHSIKFSQELKTKNILTFGVLFYVSWILSDIFNGSWIILFSFEYITIAGILLVCITISLYLNAFASHKYIGSIKQYENVSDDSAQSIYPLYLLRSKVRVTLYRIFVLNGVAFYLTWCNIATCLNVGIFLAYKCNLDVYTASIIPLTILTVIILVYLCLDFYYLREWLVYTYSPYFILIWALSGIITNSGDNEGDLKGASKVFVAILLGLSVISFVAKIISGIYYAVKQRKLEENTSDNYTLFQKV